MAFRGSMRGLRKGGVGADAPLGVARPKTARAGGRSLAWRGMALGSTATRIAPRGSSRFSCSSKPDGNAVAAAFAGPPPRGEQSPGGSTPGSVGGEEGRGMSLQVPPRPCVQARLAPRWMQLTPSPDGGKIELGKHMSNRRLCSDALPARAVSCLTVVSSSRRRSRESQGCAALAPSVAASALASRTTRRKVIPCAGVVSTLATRRIYGIVRDVRDARQQAEARAHRCRAASCRRSWRRRPGNRNQDMRRRRVRRYARCHPLRGRCCRRSFNPQRLPSGRYTARQQPHY